MIHIIKADIIVNEKINAEIERVVGKAKLLTDKKWTEPISEESLLSYYIAQTVEKHLISDIEERIKELEGAENVHKE